VTGHRSRPFTLQRPFLEEGGEGSYGGDGDKAIRSDSGGNVHADPGAVTRTSLQGNAIGVMQQNGGETEQHHIARDERTQSPSLGECDGHDGVKHHARGDRHPQSRR
jgi:hypothetical protein